MRYCIQLAEATVGDYLSALPRAVAFALADLPRHLKACHEEIHLNRLTHKPSVVSTSQPYRVLRGVWVADTSPRRAISTKWGGGISSLLQRV